MMETSRYNHVAMILHWLMALAIISLIVAGKVMTDLSATDPLKFQLYQLHKSAGITVLALAIARIGWRLMHTPPPLPATMKPWERFAAGSTHLAFYVLMIAIPLSGWIMTSTSPSGIPTLWFDLFEIPALPGLSGDEDMEDIHEFAQESHELLANLTIVLLLLHIGAALKHHFWNRDDVLKRMLPFLR